MTQEILSPEAMLARLVGFPSVVGRPNGEITGFVRNWLAEQGVTQGSRMSWISR